MKTILVVEDEMPIAHTLRAILEDEGFRVETAHNGREGLKRLKEIEPDIILCDVMMPVLDGPAMCRIMQADAAFRMTPLALMSAAPETLAQGSCRYDAFVVKPFTLDSLLETVVYLARQADLRKDGSRRHEE